LPEAYAHGPIVGPALELTASWFPRIGKRDIQKFFKRDHCLCSDHFPIVLACGGNKGGKKSFKFENMWLKEEGFVERVRGWWALYHFQGTPSFILAKKLRALKGDIKTWNRPVFGNVGALIKERVEELKALELAAEGGVLSEEESERKSLLCKDIERALLQEKINWK
jgi:hypothetical protein